MDKILQAHLAYMWRARGLREPNFQTALFRARWAASDAGVEALDGRTLEQGLESDDIRRLVQRFSNAQSKVVGHRNHVLHTYARVRRLHIARCNTLLP